MSEDKQSQTTKSAATSSACTAAAAATPKATTAITTASTTTTTRESSESSSTMTTTTSHQQQHHTNTATTAVQQQPTSFSDLNNTAVSLLQHDDMRQATCLLKAALAELKQQFVVLEETKKSAKPNVARPIASSAIPALSSAIPTSSLRLPPTSGNATTGTTCSNNNNNREESSSSSPRSSISGPSACCDDESEGGTCPHHNCRCPAAGTAVGTAANTATADALKPKQTTGAAQKQQMKNYDNVASQRLDEDFSADDADEPPPLEPFNRSLHLDDVNLEHEICIKKQHQPPSCCSSSDDGSYISDTSLPDGEFEDEQQQLQEKRRLDEIRDQGRVAVSKATISSVPIFKEELIRHHKRQQQQQQYAQESTGTRTKTMQQQQETMSLTGMSSEFSSTHSSSDNHDASLLSMFDKALYIQEVETRESPAQCEALTAAVLLYNMALAHHSRGLLLTKEKLLVKAKSMYQKSFTILSAQQPEPQPNEDGDRGAHVIVEESKSLQQDKILLSLALLNNLAQIDSCLYNFDDMHNNIQLMHQVLAVAQVTLETPEQAQDYDWFCRNVAVPEMLMGEAAVQTTRTTS